MSPVLSAVNTILIPLVTIIGLIVLMAMKILPPDAGLGLIGGLAGLHGGAAVANTSQRTASETKNRPSPPVV